MNKQLDINKCPMMNEKFKSKIKSRILLTLLSLFMVTFGIIMITKYEALILEFVNMLR